MKIIESALERLGLPAEAAGACRVTLTGDFHLSVENHRGLLEYTPELISLSCGAGTVKIRGEALELAAMEGESLVIRGKIFGIDLE